MLSPELVGFSKSSTSCGFWVGGGDRGFRGGSLIRPWGKLFAWLGHTSVPSSVTSLLAHAPVEMAHTGRRGPVDPVLALLVGLLEHLSPEGNEV